MQPAATGQVGSRVLDTVIVRDSASAKRGKDGRGGKDGELLTEEPCAWFAAPGWQHRADEPLPAATLTVQQARRQPWRRWRRRSAAR